MKDEQFEYFKTACEMAAAYKRDASDMLVVEVISETAMCPDPFTFWQYCCDNNIEVIIKE